MEGQDFTVALVGGKWRAACHHCALVQVRSYDRAGLVLAAYRHLSRRH